MAVLEVITTLTNLRLLLVSLIAFLAAYVVIMTFKRPAGIPPGPWCFPVLGYLPNITVCSKFYHESLPMVFSRLSQTYGPVFSLYLGDQLCVVLNRQDVLKEAFMNPKLSDRPTTAHTQNNEETGVLSASGQSWKAQRSFTLGIFRRFGVGKSSFEKHISSELVKLFKRFEDQQGDPFNPTSMIINAISNITMNVAVGRTYEYDHPDFIELLDVCNRIVKLAGTAGFKSIVKILRVLPSKTNKILLQTRNRFMTIVLGNIEKRKQVFDENKEECLIDVYLSKLRTNERLNPNLTEEGVNKTVASLFIAGTDTSSYQILWVLVYLLNYPDVMRKVQDEIDTNVGCDRLPELSDQTDLPFTQAVIYECMRLAAPVPMGVMHAASEDTALLEYTIPKGTMLIGNIWGVHNDPITWPQPNKFDPSRFLDENGKLVEHDSLIPFSAGRRICLGENLARMEIFLFVAQILHQFDLRVPDGVPCPSLKGTFAFNYSTEPFSVIATQRHGNIFE